MADEIRASEFTDREPLPSGLIPAERLALTVARRQLARGENPPPSITTVLVMAIDRLLAAQPPEGTVTEWSIRRAGQLWAAYADEASARAMVRHCGWESDPAVRIVSRQIGPWIEAPEPEEDGEHG